MRQPSIHNVNILLQNKAPQAQTAIPIQNPLSQVGPSRSGTLVFLKSRLTANANDVAPTANSVNWADRGMLYLPGLVMAYPLQFRIAENNKKA
jgi:hypothetical protein